MMTDTPKPMPGTWTLTAPDGRTWQAESPIRCVALESRERVPPEVALQRIYDAADEPFPNEARYRTLRMCTAGEWDALNDLRLRSLADFDSAVDRLRELIPANCHCCTTSGPHAPGCPAGSTAARGVSASEPRES